MKCECTVKFFSSHNCTDEKGNQGDAKLKKVGQGQYIPISIEKHPFILDIIGDIYFKDVLWTCYVYFVLENKSGANAVIGSSLQAYLGVNVEDPFEQLQVYSPKKDIKVGSINPLDDFTVLNIPPAGVFAVQQEFDNVMIVPLSFARKLFTEDKNVTAIEINVNTGVDPEKLKSEITANLGDKFIVQGRIQQNQALYNVLGSEKWMVYIILTFILIIAIF